MPAACLEQLLEAGRRGERVALSPPLPGVARVDALLHRLDARDPDADRLALSRRGRHADVDRVAVVDELELAAPEVAVGDRRARRSGRGRYAGPGSTRPWPAGPAPRARAGASPRAGLFFRLSIAEQARVAALSWPCGIPAPGAPRVSSIDLVKVSVIVPVYNPGSNIDQCISSLLGQSLPADEYEVIFVDDGSTDETPARLDELARTHENVRVEHIPNSGWPGRPRNIGIDLARGEFVYFVDNDDWLGSEALERLHAKALRDDSDIVIGKVVGHGKVVPRSLFRRNRSDATLEWPPLCGC